MARRLRFFHEQVEKAGIKVKVSAPIQEKTYQFDELEVGHCLLRAYYTTRGHALTVSSRIQCAEQA